MMKAYRLTLLGVWIGMALQAADSRIGPWDLNRLSAPPSVEWGVRTGRVQVVSYAGEPFQGRSTRVFGYL